MQEHVSYEFLWIRRTCDYIYSNAHYCMLFSSKVRVRIRFSVWLVSGYAHVFVLLSVVIVTILNEKLRSTTRYGYKLTNNMICGCKQSNVYAPCQGIILNQSINHEFL